MELAGQALPRYETSVNWTRGDWRALRRLVEGAARAAAEKSAKMSFMIIAAGFKKIV